AFRHAQCRHAEFLSLSSTTCAHDRSCCSRWEGQDTGRANPPEVARQSVNCPSLKHSNALDHPAIAVVAAKTTARSATPRHGRAADGAGRTQFQHFELLADIACPGYATRPVRSSACAFIRVPAAKSSGDCLQPCSMTMSGTACPRYPLGMYSRYSRVPA